jgi:hypothetical protein
MRVCQGIGAHIGVLLSQDILPFDVRMASIIFAACPREKFLLAASVWGPFGSSAGAANRGEHRASAAIRKMAVRNLRRCFSFMLTPRGLV